MILFWFFSYGVRALRNGCIFPFVSFNKTFSEKTFVIQK